jgi:acetyl-CoA C-acetyltransferase
MQTLYPITNVPSRPAESNWQMSRREIFVVTAMRTAIGAYCGSLRSIPLAELATSAVQAALVRSGTDPSRVDYVIMGNVIPTEPRDAHLARVAAIGAGIPKEAPAFTLNRACGSGLQAIVSGAQLLWLGEADMAIAGGAESMSRSLQVLSDAHAEDRRAQLGPSDYLARVLEDPVAGMHYGIAAEYVASRNRVTRQEQDAFALESHRRAARAIAEGRFKSQIFTMKVIAPGGVKLFDIDEQVRSDVSPEALSAMKPLFKSDGSVTAGNATGPNDGAAAVVLATCEAVRSARLTPLARLVSYAHAAVEPSFAGLGAVPASQLALKRAGLVPDDLDVIELNGAFAAQACAVIHALRLDPARVNPNGSELSIGHPLGATGAILTAKAIYELERTSGRYALVAMSIIGGQGIAAIFERE